MRDNYFEGWYFKNVGKNTAISFIPGINISNGQKSAFIQIITEDNSFFIDYPFSQFKLTDDTFSIKIGENYFSNNSIHLDNSIVSGNLSFTNNTNIKKNIINPNIMGPFAYIPFMECKHDILSMKHNIYGSLKLENKVIDFDNGCGYIEKDAGTSFPKWYIWCQANCFENKNCSLFFSIADIPFKSKSFNGFICSFILNGTEYRFATYNNSKCIFNINDNELEITLVNSKYNLNIHATLGKSFELAAPVKGRMDKKIKESINSNIDVTFKIEGYTVYTDTSNFAGIEIVK